MFNPRKSIVIASVVAFAALAVGCGSSTDSNTTATPVETTPVATTDASTAATPAVYTEATPEIAAQAGEEFIIQLPANPGTGYSWSADIPAEITVVSEGMLSAEGMEVEDMEAEAMETEATTEEMANEMTETEPIVGAPTTQQWLLRAETAGEFQITFSEFAPGGETAERIATFAVTVS